MAGCKIEGCGKPVEGWGWCRAHYQRWQRHGDPLGGGVPRGETLGSATLFYREVVLTDARGPNDPCLIWPFARGRHGYAEIQIDGKQATVSRFVCREAHGEPPTPKHDAAHSCGKGHLGCVTKSHLDWKTRAENMADQLAHGTRIRGTKSPFAKLTEADVVAIRSMRGSKSLAKIGAVYGVSKGSIYDIIRGRTWAWLE